MKRGKAPGEDGICNDLLNEAAEIAEEKLSKLVSRCLKEERVRKNWKNASIVLLHKKEA